jgi:glycerate dehydrogenase
VLDGRTLNPGDLDWSPLNEFGRVDIYPETPPGKVVERVKPCQILALNKVVINQDILEELPELEFITMLATGYDNVDIRFATSRGIVVSNVVGYATQAVAQHVFALILHWTNKVSNHASAVRAGKWLRSGDFAYYEGGLAELNGKTMGIFGYGRIGRQVSLIARAFQMKTLVVSSHGPGVYSDESFVDEETLLSASDFISLNTALTPENRKMVNREFLQKMKPSAVLVNTARGDLVDEKALASALSSGAIAAACLDVMQTEPPPSDHPLMSLPNCIITSHMAWTARETRQRLLDEIILNIRAFLRGKPKNVVRPAPDSPA